MTMMCARQRVAFPYNTVDISQVYDPFDVRKLCVNFITWMEPTPYTTPLYIYKMGDGVFATFEEHKELERKLISPIYVLTKKPNAHTIFIDKKNWFNIVNGIPDFKFQEYMGRCDPNPDGKSLGDCVVGNATGLVKPLSLLKYLENVESNEKDGYTVPKLFQKTGIIFASIVLIVFLVALFAVVWLLFKNEKTGRYGD
jgi:hypothetical protein